jgi:3-oxoacyl-[acyl-carrier protein] reductase
MPFRSDCGLGGKPLRLGLEGKRAVVSAASSGLGLASASVLAAEGAQVAICSRDPGRIAEAAEQIGAAAGLVADVSTVDGAERFIAQAREALGGIDILVCNSGGSPAGTFATTDLELYAPALEQNLLATVAMCRAAVPHMQQARWGRVVAITSIAVRQPIATLILSNTARAGLTGFLKTLALDVAVDGVTVNSVLPGYHATSRLVQWAGSRLDDLALEVPAGRIGDPADLGAIVAFLCSEQAGYITGSAIPVDGGDYRGLL